MCFVVATTYRSAPPRKAWEEPFADLRASTCPRTNTQVSPSVTHHGATALFLFFGARSLYSSTLGWDGGEQANELHEVEEKLGAAAEAGTPGSAKKGKKAAAGSKTKAAAAAKKGAPFGLMIR